MPTLIIKADEILLEAIKNIVLQNEGDLINILVDSYGLQEEEAENMINAVKIKEN